jgi:pimeloyl-ACP methyl ester carboxylesterase
MILRILLYVLLALLVILIGLAIWLYTPDGRRAAVEKRWVAPPSTFAEVDGVRLHLRDTGPLLPDTREAPAILFLHGFGSSLHTWDDVAAGLEDRFRVLRIDLPGFGLTGAHPTGEYTDARSHAVIASLLDRLVLDRVHLVGSSMGGRIAWTFAAAQPDRVARLVLMAPDGFASPSIDYNRAPRVPLMMQSLHYTLPRFMVKGGMAPAYADPAAMTDALVEGYHAMMVAPGVRQAILDRMDQHMPVPPGPLLAEIAAPTLLLWGAQDHMVPPTNAEDYLRVLPDARRVVLEGVGHVPMEEAPAEVVRVLREFLAE